MLFPSPSLPLLPVPTIVESTSCVHLPRLSFGEDSVDDKQQPQTPPPQSPFASSFQWAFRAIKGTPSPKPSNRHSRAMADLMDIDNSFYSNSRTRAPFRPSKANKGTPNWQLKQFAEATLGSGSLRKAVKLPEGEDENEWLAVNGAFLRT
jgi:Mob1/phocein family